MPATASFPFQISGSTEISDQLYHITPEEHRVLEKAGQDAHRSKKDARKRLERYVQQYPHLPQFKNYLAVYYQQHGEHEKAVLLNQETLKLHPDYLFARVGVATDLYQKGQWTEMLPLLGEDLELNALFPERNIFHVSEVMSYYGTVALYLNAAGKSTEAWELMGRLAQVDPDHYMLKKVQNAMMLYNMERAQERMAKWEETSRTVEGSMRPAAETAEQPQFENSLVNMLYAYDMTLPPESLRQIMALPPESLVADLKKVLADSRARYPHLQDEAVEEQTHFPVHALLILAELGRTDALPDIFELLRNGEAFNDFYFGDISTELLWVVFYKLGQPDMAPLFRFLQESNVSTYSKVPVTQALEQLYYHQPGLRLAIAEGLHNVAQHFLDHRADENLVDTVVIAGIAGLLWELGGEAYKETIKALYDQDLVYVGAYGTYEELLEWKADPEKERLEVRDIYGIYAHVTSTWAGYKDDEDGFEDDEDELTEDADWEMAHTPFVRPEPKVGRNDPCPCGSGKKYKKCCGKE